MLYYCVNHFFELSSAGRRFRDITKKNELEEGKEKDYLRYASNGKSWCAIKKKEKNIITMIAHLEEKPSFEDFFTVVEYRYNYFTLKTLEIFNFRKRPSNRWEVTFRRHDERKYFKLLQEITEFSRFAFLINHYYKRSFAALEEIGKMDKKISRRYDWRIPEDSGEEFLKKLEGLLNECGKIQSTMKSDYHLAAINLKNLQNIANGIQKTFQAEIETDAAQIYIDEIRFNCVTSKDVYERLRDMKDIALGKSGFELQKYSTTIYHAAVLLEFFIVYAYTAYVWSHVNATGFNNSPIYLKFAIPLMISLGVVFLVESVKHRVIQYEFENIIWIVISIVLIFAGIYVLTL